MRCPDSLGLVALWFFIMVGTTGNTVINGATPQEMLANAQRNFQDTQNQSIGSLVDASKITQKDGKSYWFGIELSPDMANTMALVSGLLPNYVNELLRGGVYKHAESLTNYLNKKFELGLADGAWRRAGLRASLAVSGLVVAAQPLTQVAVSVRDHIKNRAEIKKALADIIEHNKQGYEDNEVIKTAMERANDTMWTGIEHAAAELPMVILNGYYALQGHKQFKEETGRTEALKASFSSSNLSAAQRLMEADAAEMVEREGFVNEYGEEAAKKYYDRALQERKEEERRAKRNSASTTQNDNPKNEGEMHRILPLLGTGIASSLIKGIIAKSDKEGKSKHCAYELIMQLQEKAASGHISESSNISKQVIEIFQQNEMDRGRPPFGPVLLEKMEPLAKRIAEVVAKNEVEPLALVNLVGEGKVSSHRHFVSQEKLEEIIDEQRRIFGTHERTSLDDFLADFQSPKVVLSAVTENLKNLQGNQKALFATLFSDDVLLAAGIKKEEILPLRSQGHDFMFGFVVERTKELAQKTKEELANEGLSKKQIESIFSLNGLIEAGNERKVHDAINGGDLAMAAVRNATITEQLKGGDAKALWVERVAKVSKKEPAEIAKDREEEQGEPMSEKVARKHHHSSRHSSHDEPSYSSSRHSSRGQHEHSESGGYGGVSV